MAMTPIEVRILGALIEKERTTPEYYPLTTNALVAACNQKSNRDPITNYSILEVEETLRLLRDKGLTETKRAANERAFKHQHKLKDALNISNKELAILAVLMLRGHQTPGELRNRTERYTHFQDLNEVENTLQKLAQHSPPLAKNHGRGPGQSQDRWSDTLSSNEENKRPRVRATSTPNQTPPQIQDLQNQIQTLQKQLKHLYEHLELELPD